MAEHREIPPQDHDQEGNGRGRRLIGLGVLALWLVGADQLTKILMVNWLSELPGGRVEVIPRFFDLTLVYNRGAAFGAFAQADYGPWFLVGLTVVAVGVAIWLALTRGSAAILWSMGLITGGAVGNLVDRLRLGRVVDFIYLHYDNWYFPAFNLADSAITIGGVLLAWMVIRGKA
jgi:signal peptidase II